MTTMNSVTNACSRIEELDDRELDQANAAGEQMTLGYTRVVWHQAQQTGAVRFMGDTATHEVGH